MKLTNTLRDAFIHAVMQDVPSVDYAEMLRKEAADAVVAALPEALRKAWAVEANRPYIQTCSRDFGGVGIYVPGYSRWVDGRHTYFPAVAAAASKKLDDLAGKHDSQEEARKSLRSKLRGAAYAASTRKQLAEMLPEFERYLPPDEAAANRSLPVVTNLVADFVKAGWPKGKKPSKAVA